MTKKDHRFVSFTKEDWLKIAKRYRYTPYLAQKSFGCSSKTIPYYFDKFNIPWREKQQREFTGNNSNINRARIKELREQPDEFFLQLCARHEGKLIKMSQEVRCSYDTVRNILRERNIDWQLFQPLRKTTNHYDSLHSKLAVDRDISLEELRNAEEKLNEEPKNWAEEAMGV